MKRLCNKIMPVIFAFLSGGIATAILTGFMNMTAAEKANVFSGNLYIIPIVLATVMSVALFIVAIQVQTEKEDEEPCTEK